MKAIEIIDNLSVFEHNLLGVAKINELKDKIINNKKMEAIKILDSLSVCEYNSLGRAKVIELKEAIVAGDD